MVITLGIDVGLANLGVCVMEKDFTGPPAFPSQCKSVKTLYWKRINLLLDKCVVCGKAASTSLPDKMCTVRLSLCKRHSKKYFSNVKNTKHTCKTIPQGILCRRIAQYIWQDLLPFKNIISKVCIELQPPKNKIMQKTSHYIFMTLILFLSGCESFEYVNAKQKLFHFCGPSRTPEQYEMLRSYSGRKQLAIQDVKFYTSLGVAAEQEKVSADEADCFLYALYA